MTRKSYSDGTPGVAFGYDGAVPYSIGRLTSVATSSVTRNIAGYDVLGHMSGESQTVSSGTPAALTYSWNLAGDMTEEILPSGRKVDFGYDGVNRLCGAVEGASAAITPSCSTTSLPSGANWWQTYVYDKVGNRALVTGSYGTSGSSQAQVASATSAVPFDSHNRWTGAAYDTGGNETAVTAGGFV